MGASPDASIFLFLSNDRDVPIVGEIYGDREAESRALAEIALRPDIAPLAGNQLTADIEPQTETPPYGAGGFGRVGEAVKKPLPHFGVDGATGVWNFQNRK